MQLNSTQGKKINKVILIKMFLTSFCGFIIETIGSLSMVNYTEMQLIVRGSES